LAVGGRIGGMFVPGLKEGGGSTLSTQTEKFRHSPRGLTGGVGEKLRQMATASARVYSGGRDTFERRKEIVATYLNSTPLSSMPGYGEIIGLPEALWVWFGTEIADANRVLTTSPRTRGELARKGEVYRQVLSLILAERRPSYYLLQDRDALGELTDNHLRLLCDNGVIDPQLRDAALAADLKFRDQPPLVSAVAQVRQKSTEEVRNRLVYLLGVPDLYVLDRLDLTAETSIDTAAQARVTSVLQKLSDRNFVQQAGASQDPLTAWAATYLARSRDRGLQPMLEAAMQRQYSGAPEMFFTGGGVQSFGNFESSENSSSYSVEQAFQHSVNLSFVRLL